MLWDALRGPIELHIGLFLVLLVLNPDVSVGTHGERDSDSYIIAACVPSIDHKNFIDPHSNRIVSMQYEREIFCGWGTHLSGPADTYEVSDLVSN